MQRIISASTAILLVVGSAPAQVVTITKIVDYSTVAPGGPATFTSFGSPIVDGSTVVFSGAVGNSNSIYSSTGGVISTLLSPGAPIPNGTGNFSSVGAAGYKNG